ncbi:MAG: outer spore coat protein CotE [Bacilli bacterium]|nr:outer spore coat protein CotE [Bacilli bacterium]MBR2997550.1 outer spore coat protein CotE [Bacilli bacterium]
MSKYREIVTKAIIGKGKKYFKNKYNLEASEKPSTVLGCWIINNRFNGKLDNNDAVVNGTFDINIWYSVDNNTKTNVLSDTISYNDVINIKSKLDVDLNDAEIIVKVLKQPECTNVNINGNSIEFEIEKELGIEVVGDTKVKILTEEDEEDWVSFDDKLDEDVNKAIDEVKDNFIE